jgi:hypothetical protein
VVVSIAAVVSWATQDEEADAGFLVEVNSAGAFLGSVVALSVGFGLTYLEWAIDHTGQSVVAERPRD